MLPGNGPLSLRCLWNSSTMRSWTDTQDPRMNRLTELAPRHASDMPSMIERIANRTRGYAENYALEERTKTV